MRKLKDVKRRSLLRKSTMLFGQELVTDKWLEWRVKLCQRLGGHV